MRGGAARHSRRRQARLHRDARGRDPADIDWNATLAFREHLWQQGLGVAEAMDTAQHGLGLDWAATQELIRRSSEVARAVGGRIASGAGTDQVDPDEVPEGKAGLSARCSARTSSNSAWSSRPDRSRS